MPADGSSAPWFLYLLECEGNKIYTGITTDVERRFAQHQAGTGAKYTRSHKPIRVLGWKEFENRSEASKAEAAAKRLNSAQKRDLCAMLSTYSPDVRLQPAA
ncbi:MULTISPECIES: GIY-YIG nuclease family protein [Cupriavidus]